MVTTEELVAKVNAIAGTVEVAAERICAAPIGTSSSEIAERVEEPEDDGNKAPEQVTLQDPELEVGTGGQEQDDACPPLEDQGEDDSDNEFEEESVADLEEMELEAPEPRRSERIKAGVGKPERYAMAAERVQGHNMAEKVKEAEIAEIKQVFGGVTGARTGGTERLT
jgi:hypothetical protein